MLEAATGMIVLKLDGWEESKGIAYELDKAKLLGIPVSYLPPPEIFR
jgi:hypothetical protein